MIESNKVKPVLSSHSKVDKTKVLKTNGSLIKVEKKLQNAPLGAFYNTFDLYFSAIIGIENQFWGFFLSGLLRQVLLYSAYRIWDLKILH